ncbi:L-threonylcarbamoyladenylate synthase [Fretibacter rubidus]
MSICAKIRPAGPKAYQEALDILRAGGLVALPTETVYGLSGDASNDDAVRRIYAVKGRPAYNPLIAHVLSPDGAQRFAHIPPLGQALITRYWPGPLTLVMPRKDSAPISAHAGAGLDTIALRCPQTPWARSFIEAGFDGALVMPSANRSGRISPTTAEHVADDLGDTVDMIIDAGPCPIGVESTVVQINGDSGVMLRPGGISFAELSAFDARITRPQRAQAITAPGMLKSHYAPRARVRLNVKTPEPGEPHLGFGACFTAPGLNLSKGGDVNEAARNLFDFMRRLDTKYSLAVAPIPTDGIGAAINDRLKRAAAERDT